GHSPTYEAPRRSGCARHPPTAPSRNRWYTTGKRETPASAHTLHWPAPRGWIAQLLFAVGLESVLRRWRFLEGDRQIDDVGNRLRDGRSGQRCDRALDPRQAERLHLGRGVGGRAADAAEPGVVAVVAAEVSARVAGVDVDAAGVRIAIVSSAVAVPAAEAVTAITSVSQPAVAVTAIAQTIPEATVVGPIEAAGAVASVAEAAIASVAEAAVSSKAAVVEAASVEP